MDITADQTIPEIAPTFRLQWEKAQNCYVVLYPEGMVKLSPSAGEIMKRIDGAQSVADIISELQQQFPDAELEQDVRKFMEVAHDNGWIRAKQ
ncbi:pyrroloquinoline quinone biosynthesis protein D [Methylohalomonas lacus]|uniref:PqqA binding protein n=1 Tax=Methylohalomonas lacus TaxID=398773 RepID=A0AAE3HHS7_9GAMM|nr:pyrroloquinoline quinone biosynthesis peptide chaperone PqqD [Methylohalomonas lacus]MCS3902586.1 pyrroloquinoline quinone biosynthesis protein D [Methylohalomonas lacus]